VTRVGETVELRDGDARLAEAVPTELVLDAPRAASTEEARAASKAGYELWTAQHFRPE
jgi:hypothetical protein